MSALSDATEFHNALSSLVAGYGRRLEAMARENKALSEALNEANAKHAEKARLSGGLTEALAKANGVIASRDEEIVELKRKIHSLLIVPKAEK